MDAGSPVAGDSASRPAVSNGSVNKPASKRSAAGKPALKQPVANPAGDVMDEIAQAVSRIVFWPMRNNVQRQIMSRANCDLPRTHVLLLTRVHQYGPARLSELAAAMTVDKSTLTPMVQRLEDRGYLVRGPDPSDKRASVMRITRSGRRLLERLHDSSREMFIDLLQDWSMHDREQLAHYIGRLGDAMVNPDDIDKGRASDNGPVAGRGKRR